MALTIHVVNHDSTNPNRLDAVQLRHPQQLGNPHDAPVVMAYYKNLRRVGIYPPIGPVPTVVTVAATAGHLWH